MQVKCQLGSLSTLAGSRALHGLGWQGAQEKCPLPHSCRWIPGTSLQPCPAVLAAPGADASRRDSGE